MIEIIRVNSDTDERKYISAVMSRERLGTKQLLRTVEDIVDDIRSRGDDAVSEYTAKFDGVVIPPGKSEVSRDRVESACEAVDPELAGAIRRACANIRAFHEKQLEKSWSMTGQEGVTLGQLYRPVEFAGIYVPGGTAPLPSSVLMNAVPAKVAGVENIIMTTPPSKNGSVDPVILFAAHAAGVDRIFMAGGAQAVAAMAFGTRTIPRVDKITGPGNIYVALAKKLVYGYCGIDMIAGPSEVLIIADDTAYASFVAADMLSQAEHDPLAMSVLITDSGKLAKDVSCELERRLGLISRSQTASAAINNNSAIIVVDKLERAFRISNAIAPEHLELCIADPLGHVDGIRNAGAIFAGNFTPEPVGDYYAGTNHILPTGGTSRFYSPLSVGDFIKKTALIFYSSEALAAAKDDIVRLAEAEGLTAHADSIKVRFEERKQGRGKQGCCI